MLSYPVPVSSHLTYLVPLPVMIEDEHDDVVPALEVGDLSALPRAERRAVILALAAELMLFLGEECVLVARLHLSRTTIVLEHAFRDPHPAFERLVAFCDHWRGRRAALAC